MYRTETFVSSEMEFANIKHLAPLAPTQTSWKLLSMCESHVDPFKNKEQKSKWAHWVMVLLLA